MIDTSLTLPCGVTIPNRIAKAAMTERLGNGKNDVTEAHLHLYEHWAATGAGLLITGNVMIDNRHLESAGNVCIHTSSRDMLSRWADAGKQYGSHLWMQISHAGRQTSKFNSFHPEAPSAVRLKTLGLFGTPKPLTEQGIEDLIGRYVESAVLAKETGFTGVQFHAAHGYLISQFLSPLTNQRHDRWGGTLENRSRLLREVIVRSRHRLGTEFPISVKLNSADFQRGGFDEQDALEVVRMLADLGVDLLEISGGTYEHTAFLLENEEVDDRRESTRRREAYFIDFAERVREISEIPLMVTGGFRSYKFCTEVLKEGKIDMIGMARPFLTDLEKLNAFIEGKVERLSDHVIRTGIPLFEGAAEGGLYARQIFRLAQGKAYKHRMSPLWSAIYLVLFEFFKALRRRRRIG